MMDFEGILSRIRSGEEVHPSDLLPFLCREQREERCNINAGLAEAYLNRGTVGHLQLAKIFIQRAWVLGGFSPDLLPLYIKINLAVNEPQAIREAYKRLGMKMASRGEVSEAIRYFDLWQYAYPAFHSVDRYEYDFDILESIEHEAVPYRLPVRTRIRSLKGRKIRLAYLVKGMGETGSVLLKMILIFAKFHDRSRFELTFFTPETERIVLDSEMGRENIKLFESCNCRVTLAPNREDTKACLLEVAQRIYDAKPDILITSAALADFRHYFLISLRPAPVTVGLVQGPPPQFAPPSLDWGIAWTKHPLIDCPANCSLVDMEEELPQRKDVVACDRREFNIPDQSCLLVSAGRHVKFQDPGFWKTMINVLAAHPETFYLAIGVEEDQLPFLGSLLPQEIRNRIRLLSWRREEDYLKILILADILIDTFPSGGGAILFDAMSLGIPVVSFRNDYMRLFDQTNWSVAEEILHLPEMIVSREDLSELGRVLSKLIRDKDYRVDVGRSCQEHIFEKRSNPRRAIRKCEEIYIRVLEEKLARNPSADKRREPLRILLRAIRMLSFLK